MLTCWHPSAHQRPSFHQLTESVSHVVISMRRQIQSWRTTAAHYVNASNASDEDELEHSVSSQLSLQLSVSEPQLTACRTTTV